MKRNILFGALVLFAGSLFAADAGPKDDVVTAAKKLADKSNYSWKMTLDLGPNSQFQPGPTEGKTVKDGATWLSATFNDNTSEGIRQGGKVAIKTDAGWQSAAEATADGGGGGFNPAAFMARRMQNLKTPADEVQDLVSKAKELKKDGDLYSADLTEEGVKALLVFRGGRRNADDPGARNAKGSAKFWIKDGAVTKYEFHLQGTVRGFDGNDMEADRTATVEIKDVDTTKVEVPEDAKKKLS